MPAPTNTSATTATDLGSSLPVTVTQDVTDGAGTTYDVWYKYTAQSSDIYLSIFGFGDLTIYKPAVEVFLGPDTAPVEYLSGSLGNSTGTGTYRNVPLEFPVTNGTTYYFKVKKNGTNPSPASLSLTLKTFTNSNYSAGDLLIPTDFNGLGYTVIARSDASPIVFGASLPACEFGDILDDGKFALEDKHNSKVYIFDKDFTQLAVVTNAVINTRNLIRGDESSNFYVVDGRSSGATRGQYLVLDTTGSVVDSGDLGTGSSWVHSIAVNPAATRLYFNQNLSPNVISVWDIVNKVQLADLVTGPAGYTATDMVCLEDGTLVVAFDDLISNCIFKRYNSSGTELNSYSYSSLDGINITKLARSVNSGHFVAYLHLATAYGRVLEIRVSDDTVLVDNEFPMFDQGAYQPTSSATPAASFQAEDSCPIIQLRFSESAGTPTITSVTGDCSNPTTLTIVGTNLASATVTVTNGSGTSLTVTLVSDTSTQIVVTVPQQLDQTYNVTVTTSSGSVGPTQLVKSCPINTGLYQVVRGKLNDTLWDTGNTKIPDPFVKTGLFSQ